MTPHRIYDVSIVGAGPAGLAAALLLGRCRRQVFICDSDEPRNGASKAVHAFLTREGTPPRELRRLARQEVLAYPTVSFRHATAVEAVRSEECFTITLDDGSRVRSRILLLATGRIDLLPDIPGCAEYYGRGVFHCPYCDGWEHRDQPMAAFGPSNKGGEFALELLVWSRHVTFCTHGPADLSGELVQRLAAYGVRIEEVPVARLEGDGDSLTHVRLSDGRRLPCAAFFFLSEQRQHSALAENLGASFDEEGSVICEGHAATSIPGLYVAGNTSRGLQLAIMAAAEGTAAAYLINEALQEADSQV